MVDRLLHYLPEEIVSTELSAPFGPAAVPATISKDAGFSQLESPWQELVAHNRLSPEAAACAKPVGGSGSEAPSCPGFRASGFQL